MKKLTILILFFASLHAFGQDRTNPQATKLDLPHGFKLKDFTIDSIYNINDSVLVFVDENGNMYTTGSGTTIYTVGASTLFLHSEVSVSVPSYNKIYFTPADDEETTNTATVNSSSGEVLIKAFISDSLQLLSIPSGEWDFSSFLHVNSSIGVTSVIYRVYKRTSLGVETELFNATTSDINNTTSEDIETETVQPSFVIDPTDRLVVKYYAQTTSISDRIVTLTYEGSINYSHIHTPIAINLDLTRLKQIKYVDFDTAQNISWEHGTFFYSYDDYGLVFHSRFSDVSANIPFEIWRPIRNMSGSTMLNGTPVYHLGTTTGGIPNVSVGGIMDSDSANIIGVLTMDILDNQIGIATTNGQVRGIPMDDFANGDKIYAYYHGLKTNEIPEYPLKATLIGRCDYSHATQGILFVDIYQFDHNHKTSSILYMNGDYTTASDSGHFNYYKGTHTLDVDNINTDVLYVNGVEVTGGGGGLYWTETQGSQNITALNITSGDSLTLMNDTLSTCELEFTLRLTGGTTAYTDASATDTIFIKTLAEGVQVNVGYFENVAFTGTWTAPKFASGIVTTQLTDGNIYWLDIPTGKLSAGNYTYTLYFTVKKYN